MQRTEVDDDFELEHLSRSEFLDIFAANYKAGEHVAIVGPNGSGKTTVAFQMLDRVATPDLRAVVLVMKPRDSTVDELGKRLGFRRVEQWPPMSKRDMKPWSAKFGSKIRGYMLWPRQSLRDIRRDDAMLAREFAQAIVHCYRAGDHIIVIDEAHSVQNDLKLRPEIDAVLMKGRSLKCSGWLATQRPRYVTLNMYSQSEHLVLFRTPDSRDVKVYQEIGGIDPELVEEAVSGLDKHSFVYIGRSQGVDDDATMVVVKGE